MASSRLLSVCLLATLLYATTAKVNVKLTDKLVTLLQKVCDAVSYRVHANLLRKIICRKNAQRHDLSGMILAA